uniref:Uncharacterized protein n=1 Tax=Anguilla anguilla TaxID=7936 RepID=A0A0E9WY77_ANGAN
MISLECYKKKEKERKKNSRGHKTKHPWAHTLTRTTGINVSSVIFF